MIAAAAGAAVTVAIALALTAEGEPSVAAATTSPSSVRAARIGSPVQTIREPSTATRLADAPDLGCDSDRARLRHLEVEVSQQASIISNYPEAVLPVEIPAELPDEYREPVFRSVVEGALRDCMTAGARLAGLSCDEPPCIAVIALGKPPVDDPSSLGSCAGWRRVYGRRSRRGYDSIDCGDGRTEQAEVISSDLEAWPGWKQLDQRTRAHIEARDGARRIRLLQQAVCALQP